MCDVVYFPIKSSSSSSASSAAIAVVLVKNRFFTIDVSVLFKMCNWPEKSFFFLLFIQLIIINCTSQSIYMAFCAKGKRYTINLKCDYLNYIEWTRARVCICVCCTMFGGAVCFFFILCVPFSPTIFPPLMMKIPIT